MSYNSQMMISALEDRNDKLRKDIVELKEALRRAQHEARQYSKPGEFYLRMQRHIMSDENIRDAWNDFYVIYALAHPDIKELM